MSKPEYSVAELERGFRLGPWRVRPQGGALQHTWRVGSTRRVEPKVMQVLLALASHPRRFVSKDELFDTVWHCRPSSDDRLTRAIHNLRQALDDDPQQPRFIETRHNVGYRLIAPVRPRWQMRPVPVVVLLVSFALATAWHVLRPAATMHTGPAAIEALSEPARAQYLQARYWLAQGAVTSLESSLRAFTDLAVAEPDFAPAWQGQAEAQLELFKLGAADIEALRRARTAGERALEIAGPTASLATCLGQVRLFLDWDLAAAESHYREALVMDPRDRVARVRYSWLLVARGDYAAAAEQIETVRMLDPLYYASEDMAVLLLYAGQLDAAIAELERLERTTRVRPAVLRVLGTAYWARGELEVARDTFVRMWDAAQPLSVEARAELVKLTPHELLRSILAEDLPLSPVALAGYHALLGEHDAALDVLEEARTRHVPQLLYVGAMPEFFALHTEPRFVQLLGQIGVFAAQASQDAAPQLSSSILGTSQGGLRSGPMTSSPD